MYLLWIMKKEIIVFYGPMFQKQKSVIIVADPIERPQLSNKNYRSREKVKVDSKKFLRFSGTPAPTSERGINDSSQLQ